MSFRIHRDWVESPQIGLLITNQMLILFSPPLTYRPT